MRASIAAVTLALAASAGLAGPAAAQSCVLLRPGVPEGGAPAPASASRDAIATVSEGIAREGVTVIAAEDAQHRMVGQPYAECARLECGAEVARALGVDFVVLVTVWARRSRPTSVVVTLIGADDSVAGDAPVERDDLAAAAAAALQVARQRWQAARMGYLVASSTPPGATVEVDGRAVGQTPLRHLVSAGERRVRVVLEGYVASEHAVVIAPSEERPLDVTLVAAEAIVAPPTAPRDEPSFVNWLVGGGLAALGVGLLIPPLHGLAVDGSCVGEPPCELVHRFGTANGVLLGLGLASLGAGVVFFVLQPFRVTASADAGSASLLVSGRF